ncbi:hypothetical protein ScPMuIL_014769 [Solemya velum]
MASSFEPVHYNIDEWIKSNEQYFLPPVCNKMMHNDGQMKSFYVGGPNQRKDYHIEDGEELFYMVKGDMCLKVVEHGKHRDVIIKEGEIFLLPAKIAHSPQRQADTIGFVIERERDESELDGLRYFVELEDGKATLDSLYEEWFHCTDLGTQLAPVIKRFFASEQYRTGKPLPGSIPEHPPIILDSKTTLKAPFNLHHWLAENRSSLDDKGCLNLFGEGQQFQVDVYGKGENTGKSDVAEILIWQLEGETSVIIDNKEFDLCQNDSLLIRVGQEYTARRKVGSVALICYQDPTRK